MNSRHLVMKFVRYNSFWILPAKEARDTTRTYPKSHTPSKRHTNCLRTFSAQDQRLLR